MTREKTQATLTGVKLKIEDPSSDLALGPKLILKGTFVEAFIAVPPIKTWLINLTGEPGEEQEDETPLDCILGRQGGTWFALLEPGAVNPGYQLKVSWDGSTKTSRIINLNRDAAFVFGWNPAAVKCNPTTTFDVTHPADTTITASLYKDEALAVVALGLPNCTAMGCTTSVTLAGTPGATYLLVLTMVSGGKTVAADWIKDVTFPVAAGSSAKQDG